MTTTPIEMALAPDTVAQDRDARFQQLVRASRDRAAALAYHLTGDREVALDLTQEAFLRAYRALPEFREEASMETWVLRILVNLARKHRRWRKVRDRWDSLWRSRSDEPPVDLPLAREARAPDRALDDGDLRRRIGAALDRLPEGQRATFALVYLEGLTLVQAAEVLGKAPGTVKSHLHRALTTLRNELADLHAGQDDGEGER